MPTEAVSILCKNGMQDGDNHHFFVNSVDFIAKVIKASGLKPDDVRIVCSTSGDSRTKNTLKLGAEYPIDSTKSPVKKINFYTSTSFEGCDIYDNIGRIYIIAVGSKNHTLMDIPTTFRQVCGRLRNTQYQNQINLLFSSSYNSSISINDFATKTRSSYRYANNYCDMINALSDTTRQEHVEKHKDTT